MKLLLRLDGPIAVTRKGTQRVQELSASPDVCVNPDTGVTCRIVVVDQAGNE